MTGYRRQKNQAVGDTAPEDKEKHCYFSERERWSGNGGRPIHRRALVPVIIMARWPGGEPGLIAVVRPLANPIAEG
jgi:hypothetical protein